MTIALGIIGPFGIVIAADSEEGTGSPGDLKSSTVKITGEHHLVLPDAGKPQLDKAILISGAGDSGYLAALKAHLIDDFATASINSIEVAAVGSGESWVRNLIPVAATMEGISASVSGAYGIFFATLLS